MNNIFQGVKNSKKQGDIGLGYAVAYYSRIGTVSIPLTDSQDYDLIVDIDDKIQRIQVKTTQFKTIYDKYQVSLSTNGGNKSRNTVKTFDKIQADILFVLCSDGSQFSIPTNIITSKYSLNLCSKIEKYQIT